MRISEVTDRTGIPARMLRYYEEQQLLAPATPLGTVTTATTTWRSPGVSASFSTRD